MGTKLKERILNLADDDLLNLYEICYADYRVEALEYAKKEIIKRNIEKKVWFYNDNLEEFGPYSRDEIINLVSSGDIKGNYNVWYEGLDDWIGLEKINIFGNQIKEINPIKEDEQSNKDHIIRPPTLNPAATKINPNLKSYDYEAAKSGVKLAGILTIISGGLWVLVAISQLFIAIATNDVGFYIQSGWNTIVSISIIVIGQGILKRRAWGYSWGVGTSGFNAALNIFLLINSGAGLNMFFIILDLAVFILLLKNKKVFEYAKENKVKGR